MDKSRTPAAHTKGGTSAKDGTFATLEKWSASIAERPRPLIRPVEESSALAARAHLRAAEPEPAASAQKAAVPLPSSQTSGAAAPMSISKQIADALASVLMPARAGKEEEAQKEKTAAAASAAPTPARAPEASSRSVSEQVAAVLTGARSNKHGGHKTPAPVSSASHSSAQRPPDSAAPVSPAARVPAPRASESTPLAMRPVSASNKLPSREFVFTIEDYENIRRRIYEFAGIALASSKQDMVYGRLAKRLRERHLSTFREYLELIDRDPAEWDIFVNALTTNLTSFFREAHHFEILARRLRQWALTASRPFRIWCCAASTGEEPYTLAMTACEAFHSLTPPVEIIASDINTQVLIDARDGIYASDRMNGISEARLQQFFQPLDGEHSSRWKVIPQLQQLVRFCRINLLEPRWPLHGSFDAIFCRNVMIYFDRETQRAILQRFLGVLEEDGELYAGHSESFLHASDLFTNVGKTVYRPTRRKK